MQSTIYTANECTQTVGDFQSNIMSVLIRLEVKLSFYFFFLFFYNLSSYESIEY